MKFLLIAFLITGHLLAQDKQKIYGVEFKVEVNSRSVVTFCEVMKVFDGKSGNDRRIRYEISERFLKRACDDLQMKMSRDKYVSTTPFLTYVLLDPKHPDEILDLTKSAAEPSETKMPEDPKLEAL